MKRLYKDKARRIFALMCVVVLGCMLCIPALAAEETSGSGIADNIDKPSATAPVDENQTGLDPSDSLYHKWGLDDPDNQVHIDPVSTDEVNEWVERKGNDVTSIMVTAGKVMAAIGLVASIICVVVGAIGNRRLMTGGFIGIVVALAAYVALTQYRELIRLFSSWVMS